MTASGQGSGVPTYPDRSGEAGPGRGAAGSGVVVFAVASLVTFLVAAAGLIATLVVLQLTGPDATPPERGAGVAAAAPAPVAIPATPPAAPMAPAPTTPPAPPRVTLPARCPANGTLVIEGGQGVFQQPVITAEMNCEVTIRGSRLTGPQVVSAGQNVKVHVESSTLEGTSVALEGGLNFEARISGNSTVTGAFAGLKSGTNAKVLIEGSRIAGGRVAVMVEGNAEIDATDATIEVVQAQPAQAGQPPAALPAAMQTALLAANNARVSLTRSHVRSPHTAIWTSLNGQLRAFESTIDGGEIAIRAEGNMTATLTATTTTGRIDRGRNATVELQ